MRAIGTKPLRISDSKCVSVISASHATAWNPSPATERMMSIERIDAPISLPSGTSVHTQVDALLRPDPDRGDHERLAVVDLAVVLALHPLVAAAVVRIRLARAPTVSGAPLEHGGSMSAVAVADPGQAWVRVHPRDEQAHLRRQTGSRPSRHDAERLHVSQFEAPAPSS